LDAAEILTGKLIALGGTVVVDRIGAVDENPVTHEGI